MRKAKQLPGFERLQVTDILRSLTSLNLTQHAMPRCKYFQGLIILISNSSISSGLPETH